MLSGTSCGGEKPHVGSAKYNSGFLQNPVDADHQEPRFQSLNVWFAAKTILEVLMGGLLVVLLGGLVSIPLST